MKDKILASLREKYKSKGFSEEALLKIAAYLEKTITEEGQIDASVTGVEDLLTGFQGEIDKRVATAVAKAKEKPAEQPAKPTEEPAKPADDTPAWAKTLNETVTNLANEVTSLKQGKTIESRRSQLETALKDAPDAFKTVTLKAFDRMNFKDDADFEGYVGEIKTDAAAAIQSAADSGLNAMGQPRKSAGGDTTQQATPEQVKAVFNKSKA